ncbi:MAG: hypothetical protein BAA04_04915 [Firmicutes bacterium ZCTH02-B6]|nr:MAG: hypothetical protein BAA04_04915 [Firmicutes bacterium ZCTH02-B6]
MAAKLDHDGDVPAWVKTATYIVGNWGFPAAVAAWLLYRIAPILEQQTRLLERILWLLERSGGP